MKLKQMSLFGAGLQLVNGQGSPGPNWRNWFELQEAKLAGGSRPMIKSMLEFYLLFSDINLDAADFFNYGCWCQLGSDNDFSRRRKGRPMDLIDRQCRNWSRCYKCLNIDDEMCVGDDQEYKVDFVPNENRFICDIESNNLCQQQTCLCDVELATQMLQNVDLLDPSFMNSVGFDTQNQCLPANPGTHFRRDECCGEYPSRFPFAGASADRACCMGKTYDTNVLECCNETGGLTLLGSCGAPVNQCTLECQNNGVCRNKNGTEFCRCKSPYSGLLCQNGPCSSNPCGNNGTCSVSNDSYVCQCDDGFIGNNCEIAETTTTTTTSTTTTTTTTTTPTTTTTTTTTTTPDPCSLISCVQGTCSVTNEVAECNCFDNWAGPSCDLQCDLKGDRVDISLVVDVSGQFQGYKSQIYDFVMELVDLFDTENQVKISLTSFAGHHQSHIDPVQFTSNDAFDAIMENMEWIGTGSNAADAIQAAHESMDLEDTVNDVMIVLTDGFLNDVSATAQAASNAGQTGVTTMVVGTYGDYYNYNAMDSIAQGLDDHIFLAENGALMSSLVEGVFGAICGAESADALMNAYLYSQQSRLNTNDFLLQAAGQFLDNFGRLPDWTPHHKRQ